MKLPVSQSHRDWSTPLSLYWWILPQGGVIFHFQLLYDTLHYSGLNRDHDKVLVGGGPITLTKLP